MDILTAQLPSGGYGYTFPSLNIKPMTFQEITEYLENTPDESDVLGKYFFDIRALEKDDPNIHKCYIMDIDFLIFYKKLVTVTDDLVYRIQVKCPDCGNMITTNVDFSKDIHFKQIDSKIMNGAKIELGGHSYETIVPTVDDFMKVFEVYLRYRKITDLKMIKTIALIKDFSNNANQVEKDVLGATHSDITLLLALRDLYYDRLEPIEVYCDHCNKGKRPEERRSLAVSVDTLITDFFREIIDNCPVDGSKILFK